MIVDSNTLRDKQWVKEGLFDELDALKKAKIASVTFRVTGMVQNEWLHNYTKQAGIFHSNAQRHVSSLKGMSLPYDDLNQLAEEDIREAGIALLRKHQLTEIPVPYDRIDWQLLTERAAKHELPFLPDSDKGMKDAIHALTVKDFYETTKKSRRIVVITFDGRLQKYFEEIFPNREVEIYATLGEFASRMRLLSQELEGGLQVKASERFFIPNDNETLYYKSSVRQKILAAYDATYDKGDAFRQHILALPPAKLKGRDPIPNDDQWTRLDRATTIAGTSFIGRRGARLYWTTRVVMKQAYALDTFNPYDGIVLNNPSAVIHSVLVDVKWNSKVGTKHNIVSAKFGSVEIVDEYVEVEPFASIDRSSGTSFLTRREPTPMKPAGLEAVYEALNSLGGSSDAFNKMMAKQASETTRLARSLREVYENQFGNPLLPKDEDERDTPKK